MNSEDVEKIIPKEINDLCYYRRPNGKKIPVFPYIIAVTGHRCGFASASSSNLPGFNEDAIKNSFKIQLEGIAHKWHETSKGAAPIILLTGMADGADQIAAEAALEIDPQLNVKVVAVLPMERNLFRRTVNNEIRFNDLMERVHYTFVLPPNSENDNSDAELHNVVPETEEACQRRYERLVNFLTQHSHVLFAFWDGIDDKDPKGTAKVVRLKLRGTEEFKNRGSFLTYSSVGPVVQLLMLRDNAANCTAAAANSVAVNELEFNEIPVFLWTRKNLRIKDESGPESKKRPVFPERSIMTEDRRLKKLVAEEPVIKKVLEIIGRLNADAVKHYDELERGFKEAESDLWGKKENPEANLDVGARVLVDHYLIADQLAILFQKHSQRLGKCCLKDEIKGKRKVNGYPFWVALLCFLGGFLGLVREFGNEWLEWRTLVIYWVAAVVIFVVYIYALAKNFLHCHFRSRAVAEALRVQIFWRIAGMNDSVSCYYCSHQIDDLEWLRTTVNGLVAFLPSPNPSGFKNGIDARLRFARDTWAYGQINYFDERIAEHRENRAVWERPCFAALLYILVIFIGPVQSDYFLWGYYHSGQDSSCLYGLASNSILLALLASFFVYQAMRKRLLGQKLETDRYERMILPYDRAILLTEETQEFDAASEERWRQILRQLGAEAISEQADWLLTVGERELTLPR